MSGEIETKQSDADEATITARWLREIELASGHEKTWRDRAEKVIKRYRDEEADQESRSPRFNILYANVEVLRGVIYQRVPVPDVRRRFLDRDPAAREAAQALQRSISYCVDSYDFDAVMAAVVEDVLLPGRGLARVRYVPTYAPMVGEDGVPIIDENTGKPMRQVVSETAEAEYTEWDMVRISPAKRWGKVRWVAFGELLTRDELVAQFGEIGRQCTLDWAPKDKEQSDEMFKRALVWTIWDKTSKAVHVVSKGMPNQRLSSVPDPLGLTGFFPCPEPVYAIKNTNTMAPIPEYTQYQDQAIELDKLTARIDALTDALRRRGLYDATFAEIEKLATAGDNEFIPVENFSHLMEKGGIEKAIYEAPIETIARVLAQLMQQREACKQIIYEVTGLADVVRGVSEASETLGAQQLKARYANSRTGPRQKAIQKFARDLYRIKSEIIAEKFSPQSLAEMSGLDLAMNDGEKKALAMQAEAAGQPAPRKAIGPTWEQVSQLLRSDKLRGFRIDIETDSTVQPDATEEQKNRIELLTAITQYVQGVGPAVQSGAMPMALAKEMLSFGVRGFKVSPQIEEALDSIGESQNGIQDQPRQQAAQMAQAKESAEVRKAMAEATEAEAKAREAEAKAMMAERQLQMPMMPAAMPGQSAMDAM